jgi:hypothetical protein
VSIKAVVASPSFLSGDAGYEYTLVLFFRKAHCLGPKLYIGRHQHKFGTNSVVLCQESTDGAVGQGTRLSQTPNGVCVWLTDAVSVTRCHILFTVAGSHSNRFSTSTDTPVTSRLYVNMVYLARTPIMLHLIGSSWSRQPDFGVVPGCICDGSLLAIGNRAGSILLLK